jgi:hypothetical protein
VPLQTRISFSIEQVANKWLRPLGTFLFRRAGGRLGPRRREMLLLTTHGRRTGRDRSVLAQGFRDRLGNLIVVAANSGRPMITRTR